jgi:hypothetical protein
MEQEATKRVIPGPDEADADEAAVGFGIATAVRDAAILVGIGLGLLYLFPILGLVISPGWRRQPQQIAPITAGLKLRVGVGLSTLPISPLAGLDVLAALAVTALLAGGFLLGSRRRLVRIALTPLVHLVHRKAA